MVYVSWGTTYAAIKVGLHDLPPFLFAGTRLGLAGLILLAFLWLRGAKLNLGGRSLLLVAVSGLLFFMGGNGLLTYAQTMVPSGMAAALVTATPLYFAVMEAFVPGGERLTARGWTGLCLGLLGVALLEILKPHPPGAAAANGLGFLLATGSSIAWALGSLLVRHKLPKVSPFAAAGWQMLVGGLALTVFGLALGEAGKLKPESFSGEAVGAFFYLLVVGSLGGFVAYNYLLAHVPPALAGTYAYVNPMVALVVGWLWLNEPLTGPMLGSMAVALFGVALLRGGGVRKGELPMVAEAPIPDEALGVEAEGTSVARHAGVHLAAPGVDPARQR